MTTSNGTKPATATLTCPAGHTWDAPKRTGSSRWCPDHIDYRDRVVSKRNMPPDLEVERWKSTSKRLEDPGYVKRWTKRWEETVRTVAARQGSFSALPLDDINEYIRHERLAELHRHFAELDPYPETEAGGTKVHPGWERARIEEVAARQSARKLGFLPDGTVTGAKAKRDPTRMQEQAEEIGAIIDDQADL